MRHVLSALLLCSSSFSIAAPARAAVATAPSTPSTPATTVVPQPPTKQWTKVVIDLSEQHLEVFNSSGTRVKRWPLSSGASSTPTPLGRFKVTSKSRSTFVTDNPAVTMQYMVRFNGNIGFHAIPRRNGKPLETPLGKRAVSHGCIRLADANARALFAHLDLASVVIVQR